MGNDYIEKRLWPRIFFTMQTGPRVFFSTLSSPAKTFVAEVVNLSEGGLGLIAEQNIVSLLSDKRQHIQIQAIEGDLDMTLLVGEVVEVRWVLDTAQVSFIGFGCQFLSLSDAARRQLQKVVFDAMTEHQKNSDD